MVNIFRSLLRIVFLFFVTALVVWLMIHFLDMEPLDLKNYLAATRMIWLRQNPYDKVEFFAPPWFALFLLPLTKFSLKISASIWLTLNLVCVVTIVYVSLHWLDQFSVSKRLLLATIIPTLMPGALFCYITGQVTPIVTLAVIFSAWNISSARYRVSFLFICFLLFTLKPHIVALPVLVFILELLRKRQWRNILLISFGILIIIGLTTIWLPNWLPSLIDAWLEGDYMGGKSGLISPGYLGLRELGIPVWVFFPLLAYTLWRWWCFGLTPLVFSLLLSVNLLLIPYSRRYDFVVLIFPLLYLVEIKCVQDLVILVISLISLFILPFTVLSVITPVLLVISLLIKSRSIHNPTQNRTGVRAAKKSYLVDAQPY